MPGIAASTRLTLVLGSAPKAVEAPEKSFAFEATWAWTSMPITISQSPLAPGMSFGSGSLKASSAMRGPSVNARPF